MFTFLVQADSRILRFFVILVIRIKCDIYVDGLNGIKRDIKNGISYANFEARKFSYLNITPLASASVKGVHECGMLCLDYSSCFSANYAALFREEEGNLCELLPSDKYNNSAKFVFSSVFNHLSIKTPCSSDPCMNNSTCVASYEDDEYYCSCVPGIRGKHCSDIANDCNDIRSQGHSKGDGTYWLVPDGGSHSNAFLAYCDMTSYNGGWTMCYTTDEYAKPRTEVTYNATFPYGTDGYRTNCNDINFTEIIFFDHKTGDKASFKRKINLPIKAAGNYGKQANTYGSWEGFGTMNSGYSYQLLICDTHFYTGFFVSGYTKCYKHCNNWCGDTSSPYFRTASTSSSYKGVAFNINGHRPVSTRLMSVGLR